MCGIVGACASWLTDSEKERFKELMTVSNLRGYQGAGVVVASNKCEVETFKTVETGTHMAHDRDFNQRIYHSRPVQSTSLLIGHTRWPTKGAVTLEATHPHEHDGFVGVHNGTITHINGKYIGKDESDSSLLYKSFADNGVIDTIKETVGAYCLVWVDAQERTLNFLRNDQRPLYLATMDNGSTMFWASERGMLDFVLGRQNLKFEVLNLLPNRWSVYEFPLNHKLSKSCVSVTELKGKAAPAVAAPLPFRVTTWTTGGTSTAISKTAQAPEKGSEGSTDSGKVTASGTQLPAIVPPTAISQTAEKPNQTLLSPPYTDKTKPRMRFNNTRKQWEEVLPLQSIPTTSTTTSGGTPKTSKSDGERQVSQSTEAPFRTDAGVLQSGGSSGEEDGIVEERDFSAGATSLFDQNTMFEGYRETTDNNWMCLEQFLKALGQGCLWCSKPQPDNGTVVWTDVDEYLCEECQADEFAKDYIGVVLGQTGPDDKLRRIA